MKTKIKLRSKLLKKDSNLTMDKILKLKQILDITPVEQGFFVLGFFKLPRTKKRRIVNKWIKNGRAIGVKYYPEESNASNITKAKQ